MARIAYEDWNPSQKSLDIVARANAVCREYHAQGYDLTLRQLYYQFVARGWLANNQRNYKSLGATIDKARKAGLMDWNYIVDRTRNLRGLYTYEDPASIVEAMQDQYHVDLWEGQDFRMEVWVEKEALAGVVQRAANSRMPSGASGRTATAGRRSPRWRPARCAPLPTRPWPTSPRS